MQRVVDVRANSGFLGHDAIFTTVSASLEALLQYSEGDSGEQAAEVSLVAEFFKDMLDLHYGKGLLRALASIEQQVV